MSSLEYLVIPGCKCSENWPNANMAPFLTPECGSSNPFMTRSKNSCRYLKHNNEKLYFQPNDTNLYVLCVGRYNYWSQITKRCHHTITHWLEYHYQCHFPWQDKTWLEPHLQRRRSYLPTELGESCCTTQQWCLQILVNCGKISGNLWLNKLCTSHLVGPKTSKANKHI